MEFYKLSTREYNIKRKYLITYASKCRAQSEGRVGKTLNKKAARVEVVRLRSTGKKLSTYFHHHRQYTPRKTIHVEKHHTIARRKIALVINESFRNKLDHQLDLRKKSREEKFTLEEIKL